MRICALTTTDNPNDYFTHNDEWWSFEMLTGARTIRAMGDYAYTSTEISNAENAKEVERAIDEIIKHDPIGEFKKVFIEVPNF